MSRRKVVPIERARAERLQEKSKLEVYEVWDEHGIESPELGRLAATVVVACIGIVLAIILVAVGIALNTSL